MEIKPTLSHRQQLVLSPRLYQSLKILRLSATELKELIQQELDENPTLELPEPSDFDLNEEAPGRELWEDYMGAHRGEERTAGAHRQMPLNPTELTASPVTLADHLTLQLDLEKLTPEKRRVGLAIIGSLDDDGYLREPIEEIAHATGRPTSEVDEVLKIIQSFDPPGVAARSLEECLILQLKQMNASGVACRIVEGHLPEIARGALAKVARSLGVPVLQVERAVKLIRSLSPSPGSLFQTSPPAGAIIPDVYVRKVHGHIQVLANKELLPRLSISPFYKEIASAAGPADSDTADYVKSKIKDANQLIKDVDQRRATITKVAKAIAEAQQEFFDRGPGYLKPLTLENIAARLDVHPSTISRAILGKYMNTPWGIFELKYFFSAGYVTGGGELSATAVKKRLSQLIADEDLRRPLSDQKLVEMLKKEGISISRRTVAKYREEAGIPPSWQRKRKAAS
jgi:RNA polymerase sigma-54 factor